MFDIEIEKILNRQLGIEAQAMFRYLALASWCDMKGFSGAAKFLYEHSDEEHLHMMKMLNYMIDKGGTIEIPAIAKPKSDFNSIQELFQYSYDGEKQVTESINEIVSLCFKHSDHTTHNFMQWYVNEQLEEENLYRQILARMKLIGGSGNSLYLIDVEIEKLIKGAGGMAIIETNN